MKTAACNIHSYGIASCEEISIYISMRSIQIANETVKINFFLYFFSLLCVGLRYRRRSTTCLRVSVWLAMCVSFRIAKQEVKQLLLFIINKQTKYEKRKKNLTHTERCLQIVVYGWAKWYRKRNKLNEYWRENASRWQSEGKKEFLF